MPTHPAAPQTQDIYQKNLAALTPLFPDVVKKLAELAQTKLALTITCEVSDEDWLGISGQDNVGGSTSTDSHFLPRTPPFHEQSYPQLQPETAGEILFIIGFGLGLELREFLQTIPDTCTIVVLEPEPQFLSIAMQLADLSDLWHRPNFHLYLGAQPIRELFQRHDNQIRAMGVELCCHQRCLKMFPSIYQPLYDQLNAQITIFRHNLSTMRSRGTAFFFNVLRNSRHLANCNGIEYLTDLYQGYPAICVAAGPSLDSSLPLLQELQDNALIIAVDSAVAALLSHNIQPHIIVSIDAITAAFLKLQNCFTHLDEAVLLHPPEIYPAVLDSWPNNNRLLAATNNNLFNDYLLPTTRCVSHQSALTSVSHLALHAAQISGASPIIITGLDLAINTSRHHNSHFPLEADVTMALRQQNTTLVPGWDRPQVETLPTFIGQRLLIEEILSQITAPVINTSTGGAFIQGAKHMPLDQARKLISKDTPGPLPQPQNICSPRPDQQGNTPLRPIISNLNKDYQQANKLSKTGLQATKRIKNSCRSGAELENNPKLAKKIRKDIIKAGKAYDHFATLEKFSRSLFPLRVDAHHQEIYRRAQFIARKEQLSPATRLFEEAILNHHFFQGWQHTLRHAALNMPQVIKSILDEEEVFARKNPQDIRLFITTKSKNLMDSSEAILAAAVLCHGMLQLQTEPREYLQLQSQYIRYLSYHPGTISNSANLNTIRQEWASRCQDIWPRMTKKLSSSKAQPVRLGLWATNFGHPRIACFLAALCRYHDPTLLHITCYNDEKRGTKLSKTLRKQVEKWHETSSLDHRELAQQIQADEINILIDLSGHGPNTRLPVFAMRAAPLQMTWLDGNLSTLLPSMDYRISDPWLSPTSQEAPLSMPHHFFCYEPMVTLPNLSSQLPQDITGHVTFGCLADLATLAEEDLRNLTGILQQTPQAKLLYKDSSLDHSQGQAFLTNTFQKRFISPDRLILRGSSKNYQQHLQTYNEIDLIYTPLAGDNLLTSCEATAMGVPVISQFREDIPASAMVKSFANATTMPGLIAENQDQAVALMIDQCQPANQLIRRKILQNVRHKSPIFSGAQFCQDLTAALLTAWEKR